MKRKEKEVYSPPIIQAVSFVVEGGFGASTEKFETDTWDDDMPGSGTTQFATQEWHNEGGRKTTTFETYDW